MSYYLILMTRKKFLLLLLRPVYRAETIDSEWHECQHKSLLLSYEEL